MFNIFNLQDSSEKISFLTCVILTFRMRQQSQDLFSYYDAGSTPGSQGTRNPPHNQSIASGSLSTTVITQKKGHCTNSYSLLKGNGFTYLLCRFYSSKYILVLSFHYCCVVTILKFPNWVYTFLYLVLDYIPLSHLSSLSCPFLETTMKTFKIMYLI